MRFRDKIVLITGANGGIGSATVRRFSAEGARLALTDVVSGGRTIPAGATVRLGLGAANRDPARWPDPERFDITRPELVSLAFGQGAHYCIGAPLARAQATAAFAALAARCPSIALASGEIRHDPRRMDRYERVVVTTRG